MIYDQVNIFNVHLIIYNRLCIFYTALVLWRILVEVFYIYTHIYIYIYIYIYIIFIYIVYIIFM